MLADACVCFVFDLATMPAAYRGFPLDTGAFFDHRYDLYLSSGITIKDFGFPASAGALSKIVAAFFANNENYFLGKVRPDVSPSTLDLVSQAYHAIVQLPVATNFDDRASTCELQFNQPIELTSVKLLTVVMPRNLYSDEVGEAMRRWGIQEKPIFYSMPFLTPEQRKAIIFEKLDGFYRDKGFI
jgi:hypothetical protein